jgi:hypothetical protein
MEKDFWRLAEAIATIAERIGAVLGWLWLMVVAASDSEWDVGGRKDGEGLRGYLYAQRPRQGARDHSECTCHPPDHDIIAGTPKCS